MTDILIGIISWGFVGAPLIVAIIHWKDAFK
jgi:hypothetical protein